MTNKWVPILDGDLADSARDAIRCIAVELPTTPPIELAADLTLWWAYAADQLGDASNRYDRATDALIRRIETDNRALGLHGGLAGAGWVLAHVSEDAEGVLGPIDEAVIGAIPTLEKSELVAGLAGLGVYLLERLEKSPSPAVAAGLEALVARLDLLGIRDADGMFWTDSSGRVDCGAAHGVPGIASVVGRIAESGYRPAAELCRDALRWLDAHELAANPDSCFPASVVNGRSVGRPSNAWCYGDPGVAVSAWNAAIRCGAPTERWRRIASFAAERMGDVAVPGLCHGAIGLAHLFNRCFQSSHDLAFRDASRRWFACGLEMRRPGHGIAGFVVQRRSADDTERWVGCADLIEGTTGIGLALLAALGDEEPRWDRLLACDLQPMRRAGVESDSV